MMEEQGRLRPDAKSRSCCYRVTCFLGTLLLLLIILTIILVCTIFKVRDPIMTLNKTTLNGTQPDLLIQPGSLPNVTLTTDVSVKNPNLATFKFNNTTTNVYYDGILVGVAHGPSGKAQAWRSLRMNTTVAIMVDRVLGAPDLGRDIGLGLVTIDSHTRIPGRVKMLFVKKRVIVEMNCTVSANITTQEIQDQRCKTHVDFKL